MAETAAELYYRAVNREGVDAKTLVVRPLTKQEIDRMGASEAGWHSLENRKSFEAVVSPQAQAKEARKAAQEAENARLEQWQNPSAGVRLQEFGARLAKEYPQLVRTRANVDKVYEYVVNNQLSLRYESFEHAYRELAVTGELSVDIGKVGFENRVLEGYALTDALRRRGDHFYTAVLKPAPDPEQIRVAKMSADEFAKKFGPVTAPQFDQRAFNDLVTECATWLSFHPENPYAGKARALAQHLYNEGITRVTQQGLQEQYEKLVEEGRLDPPNEHAVMTGQVVQTVVHPQADDAKAPLTAADRFWIQSLSADEYRRLLEQGNPRLLAVAAKLDRE